MEGADLSAIRQPHGSAAADNRFRSKTPPLNSGDHLNRFEFERRYESQPEINKAKLIEGVVYIARIRCQDPGEGVFPPTTPHPQEKIGGSFAKRQAAALI